MPRGPTGKYKQHYGDHIAGLDCKRIVNDLIKAGYALGYIGGLVGYITIELCKQHDADVNIVRARQRELLKLILAELGHTLDDYRICVEEGEGGNDGYDEDDVTGKFRKTR